MKRRRFIQTLACAGGFCAFPGTVGTLLAQSAYTGKFLIAVQLEGGVDVTSFCDPKINVPGEPEINRWARTADILQAGNIPFAPYAENTMFFDWYFPDMLVINGVDAQTNSHTVGINHNWSGRNSEGYPTITALMASVLAPELPLAYLNFGGFGNTQGIIRSTKMDKVERVQNIIFPNTDQRNNELNYRLESDWDRIRALQTRNLTELIIESDLPEGNRKNREYYLDAFTRAEGIQAFGNLIPDTNSIQAERILSNRLTSKLHQQAQISLLAFKAGVSVSADLHLFGFDTHTDHDQDQVLLLGDATNAIDYLWTYAEELELADRLVVLIGSDFGRTPYFNSSEGKDHWPIGSFIVMEKNVAYTNRVIGETDGGHNAFRINPKELIRDDSAGVIIKPAHVHKALRSYLGIDNSEITQRFPFRNTEDFHFFG